MKQLKHWQDSTNVVLGVWLVVAPLALGFQSDLVALANTVIVGVLLLATALGAIFVPKAWEEWTETALGLWLAASPWILGFPTLIAKANAVVIGLVVLTLALWALQDFGAASAEEKATH
jgi:heme/copper-type cytochrome/quinol oxidase subunit 3